MEKEDRRDEARRELRFRLHRIADELQEAETALENLYNGAVIRNQNGNQCDPSGGLPCSAARAAG